MWHLVCVGILTSPILNLSLKSLRDSESEVSNTRFDKKRRPQMYYYVNYELETENLV